MAEKYRQRYDGEWYDVTDGENNQCCGCGMVHFREYERTKDGRIITSSTSVPRKTARCRTTMKRRKEGVFAKKRRK